MQDRTLNSKRLSPQDQLCLLADALSCYTCPEWTPQSAPRPAQGGYDTEALI
ncbi:hypothetical protein ACOXXX_13775 [Thalassococcus sp. BH17M4-6]|uniref:hypothetical protein n=1 Tax=Thalassococcus sp. BH17M4-6 TaxID=3413148 RepID=UPI003BC3FD58